MTIPSVLKPKGFWHAPAKRGLRTKDHAGRYRASDDEDPQGY